MTPEEEQKLAMRVLYDRMRERLDACLPEGEAMARMLQNAPDVLGFTGTVSSLQELVFLRSQLSWLDGMTRSLSPAHVCIAVQALQSFLEARRAASPSMTPDMPGGAVDNAEQ